MIQRLFLFLFLVFNSFSLLAETTVLNFNNGSNDDYENAAKLSGDVRKIQKETDGLLPRLKEGNLYDVGDNEVKITETDKYIIYKTNNIPDHELYTNNPNCAIEQSYTFKIPKEPKFLENPRTITKSYQEIGIALNGVVIAGPFDSENKIAPYNRQIAQCGGHSDMQGMYHYHFAPMCGEENFLISDTQIGWAFDGIKIMGLADRKKHEPEIDDCNGHEHDGDYHYHATPDYPFFMGCFKAKPYTSNFNQKRKTNASCPAEMSSSKGGPDGPSGDGPGKGKKPNFDNASKVLGVSENDMKKALGPPPGDFEKASKKLGISLDDLKEALEVK